MSASGTRSQTLRYAPKSRTETSFAVPDQGACWRQRVARFRRPGGKEVLSIRYPPREQTGPRGDEVERLMQQFATRAGGPVLARLDILLDLRRHDDPRIIEFLVRVLRDSDEAREVQIAVLKQLRTIPLAGNDRSAVAHALARVVVDGDDAGLRLQAATALGCFADVEGIPAVLAGVALDPSQSLDLRFSALTSLERAGSSPETVSLVRRLTSDEILGRAAGALLTTWRVQP